VVTARQFEVYRAKGLREGGSVELVVILQNDVLDHLTTRIVAPLVPLTEGYTIDRITPKVEIDGMPYVVAMHLTATISVRNLATVVGTLESYEHVLKGAIDMVFFGV
jgi:hypothetical protein